MSKLIFQVCGAFAEFERSMIQQRIHAGLKRAKAQGKVLGRPKVDERIEAAIRHSLKKGNGTKKTAQLTSVEIGTVLRVRPSSPRSRVGNDESSEAVTAQRFNQSFFKPGVGYATVAGE